MFKKAIIAVATIAALGVTTLSSASAFSLGNARNPGIARFAHKGTTVPIAFSLYCLQHSSECRTSTNSQVAYTAKTRGLLASINRRVNASIRPLAERRDVWTLNPREGDCDDYVMTKRSFLIRAGIPSSALRVAVVRTSRGEGHAILLVQTSAGEFALDNLRKTIVARGQTGYRYVSVASSNPMRWVK